MGFPVIFFSDAAQPNSGCRDARHQDEGRFPGFHGAQNSGNRDEAKFDNPWPFSATGHPAGIGLGGAGSPAEARPPARPARWCCNEELHRQIPDIVAVEEPADLALGVPARHQTVAPVAWTAPAEWSYQPRCFHSARCGRSAPSVVSSPCPG